jgi:hypothetical protein
MKKIYFLIFITLIIVPVYAIGYRESPADQRTIVDFSKTKYALARSPKQNSPTGSATLDSPANDLCENAQLIAGPFPVTGTGTTIDAGEDCPGLLFWQAVWYAIELPYDYNDITITICGATEDVMDAGVVLMPDCSCSDYFGIPTVTYFDPGQCFTDYSGLEFIYTSILSSINTEGIVYCPLYVVNYQNENIDFAFSINVSEGSAPPIGDQCDNPIDIVTLPFSDNRNSCIYNNNYNFSGQDVVYRLSTDTCLIVNISLCDTDPIFDTYLLIYEDGDCGGTPIAYDDDSCMPPSTYGTSRIIDTLEAGVYYILIDAYGGNCGSYELAITADYCPVPGACCVESECVGTMIESACLELSGAWFVNEDCSHGYLCPGSCYQYLVGDVNMSNGQWPAIVIGSDVTYLVSYFRGLTQPCLLGDLFCSADANGDCLVIGSDVTKLVNYFRGLTELSFCPDNPACWLTTDNLPDQRPENWPGCE